MPPEDGQAFDHLDIAIGGQRGDQSADNKRQRKKWARQLGNLSRQREDARPDHHAGTHGNGSGETYRPCTIAACAIVMRSVIAASRLAHSLAVRKRSELSTTEIEDALIAKAANIGLIRMPKNG